MGKYSSDEEVEAVVQATEDDYVAAKDQLNPDDPESVASYKQARDNYFNARQASRAGRGMSMNVQ